MNLNSFIFPAPAEDKRYELYRNKDQIVFIPKVKVDGTQFHIPCLIQESKRKTDSNKFFFYFHGNAEDIFNSTSNLELLRNSLPFNTVGIEYPGYSIYYDDKSHETIESDALVVYDYFVKELGVSPKDIIICGRSIGSGPACYLAANRDPGALILISPFKSIQDTAHSILGFFKFLVADRFRNIDAISKVTCPLLLIHGQKDNLIPFSHSIELSRKCSGPYELLLPEEMDHNEFNIYEDFLEPISLFLKRHNLINQTSTKIIEFKESLYNLPEYLENSEISSTLKNKDYVSAFIRKFLKV